MNTTYNPGDRVITKIKGQEVEVSVVKLSIDVEVKAPDGSVWWRAISKVRPVGAAASVTEQTPVEPTAPPPSEPPVVATTVESPAPSEPQAVEQASAPTEAPAPVEEMPSPERRKKARKRR